MDDEIEDRRRRAEAAWEQVVRDAKHLKDVVGIELKKVKHLGLERVEKLSVKNAFESYPLVFAGAAAGAGFLFGWRGGRRRATLAAIASSPAAALESKAKGASASVSEKSFGRRIFETALLAALQRGAQALAVRAIEANVTAQQHEPEGVSRG